MSETAKIEAPKTSVFDDSQIDELQAKLDGQHVRKRSQAGMNLSYIEGWHAIAEANRIFGHGEWDRETVHLDCIWSGERMTRNGPKPAASYIARSRITVRGHDGMVTREGVGAGSGFGSDMGEAHESAAKEAETDAMKRALMTFGNPFGLALYDKHQSNVTKPGEKPQGEKAERGPKGGRAKKEPDTKTLVLKVGKDAYSYPFDGWDNIREFISDLHAAVDGNPEVWDVNMNDIKRVKEKLTMAGHTKLLDQLQEVELFIEQQFLAAG